MDLQHPRFPGHVTPHIGKQITKPVCVQNYTENIGAIDLVDTQSSFIECIRKRIKWYKKLFFHMFDMASINAFYLYKTKISKSLQLKDFRLELIKNIISKYGNQKPIFYSEINTGFTTTFMC